MRVLGLLLLWSCAACVSRPRADAAEAPHEPAPQVAAPNDRHPVRLASTSRASDPVATDAPVLVLATPPESDAGPVADAPAPSLEAGASGLCPTSSAELPVGTAAGDRRLSRGHTVVVSKSQRRLWHLDDGDLEGCWRVGLGFSPQGDKAVEGDGKTPEGWYRTSDKPWSTFDGAIAVHYPNRDDAIRAQAAGIIGPSTRRRIERALDQGQVPPQRTAMGGAILIHGGGSAVDWTLGCIALDDADLRSLRERLPAGKRVNLLVVP